VKLFPSQSAHRGFSLIEVLVATVVMSSGLAGLAALLLSALSGTARAADQAAAALLADAMLAQIALSPSVHAVLLQAPAAEPGACEGVEPCSAGQFAESGLAGWQASVAQRLPGGQGVVCRDATPDDGAPGEPACDGGAQTVVKVFWTPLPGSNIGRVVRLAG
jgi:type IV pilus assembly protein PilV